MGRWGARESLMLAGAVLLSLSVAYCSGKTQGARDTGVKATRDSLAVVVKEKAVIQKQRDSVGLELARAEKKTAKTRTLYVDNQPKIKGDSAFDKTGQFIQVLDPRITEALVASADHITSLEAELKTAKFALRVDTVFIEKQQEETRLNENIASMVRGSRLSRGIQVGVGYCLTAQGGTPCVYAGYGASVRFP